MLVCIYCDREAVWLRFLDTYWCPDCRCEDLEDKEDSDGQA